MLRLLPIAVIHSMTVFGQAPTLDRSVVPDSSIAHSDRVPATDNREKPPTVQDTSKASLVEKANAELDVARKIVRTDTASTKGVVLYAAKWCGYCRQAKAFLGQRGISYQEIDIDTRDGKLAYAKAGGDGIPMLVTNGTVTVGYSEAAYESLFPKGK
jgi:glutaredoxin